MLSHVAVGTNDFKPAVAFYNALAHALGLLPKFIDFEHQCAAWRPVGRDRPLLLLTRPYDGNEARPGNGAMLAFAAESQERVDRCHEAALQAGGHCEGPPGPRLQYHADYYGAYFRDPDGNKLCVVCHDRAGKLVVTEGDLTHPMVRDLVRLHLAEAHENSPPGGAFALDVSGLQRPGVTVWTAWDGGKLAGIAALRRLQGNTAEVKSMRTHPDYLRQGVARRLLLTVITEAASAGVTRLSLETGSGPAFEPALSLYRAHGFANGAAFSDYTPNAFSQFLHLTL